MKSKLKIADLKVKSFVITVDKMAENTFKGGAFTRRVNRTDCCTRHPVRCN